MNIDVKCYVKSLNKIVKPKIINVSERYISIPKKKKSTLGYFSDIYKFEEVVFLEYTSKKDMNSKKIYRGDILKIKQKIKNGNDIVEKGIVVFENYSWKIKCNGYVLDFSEISKETFKNIEKIGNIYVIMEKVDRLKEIVLNF